MTRLIDATALTEQIQKLCHYEHMANWLGVLIDTQPTVKVEPIEVPKPVRHGKWLPKHHYIAGHEFVSGHICSECGDDALNAEGDEFLTDYCPNCGADMRGEDG